MLDHQKYLCLEPSKPDEAVPGGWSDWAKKCVSDEAIIYGSQFGVRAHVYVWETVSPEGNENRVVHYDGLVRVPSQ